MMGLLFEGITAGSFIVFILFVAVLLGVNEATRRSKTLCIVVYCVLPVILGVLIFLGVLGSPAGNTWFSWVKVVSALAGVYGFMLIRFTKLGEKRFAAIFPVAILSLNIIEAVYREFEVFANYKVLEVDPGGIVVLGGIWNVLNAIAGILCIVTLTGFVGIKVSKDKSRDMVWPDMIWIYLIGYTLWNFTYVYNCVSTRAMYGGFGILSAALIAEYVFKRGVWLQHRAHILSFYVMFSLSIDYQQSKYFQILPTYNEGGLMTISIISLIFNVGVFAYMMYVIVRDRKNPLKEEIYCHTNYYKKSLLANNLLSEIPHD